MKGNAEEFVDRATRQAEEIMVDEAAEVACQRIQHALRELNEVK